MILEDVRLRESTSNDTQSPYYYKSRIQDITTDRGRFTTPTRAIARSEYVARSMVPLSKALPTQLAIDFRELADSQLISIMNEATAAEKLLMITKQFYDITSRAIFRISIFQPSHYMLQNMSVTQRIKFADLQADFLQRRLQSGIVTFPFLNLPITDYEKFIDNHYLRTEDISTVFVLDLKKDRYYLEEIIGHVVKKEQPTIIVLIHQDWKKSIPQHNLLGQYFDNEKIAFLACQADREDPESHTSNLHSIAIGGGFDIVALKQVRGYSNKQDLNLGKIKFLDPRTLLINNIDYTLNDPTRHIVEEFCLPPNNYNDFEYLTKITNRYIGAKVNPKKFQILYYLARTHEAIVSPSIFGNIRKRIINKEIDDYIVDTKLHESPIIKDDRL
jgi:hypothetical protein